MTKKQKQEARKTLLDVYWGLIEKENLDPKRPTKDITEQLDKLQEKIRSYDP